MIDFLILYEHKTREMESVLLLQYELKRRGYIVDLCNVYKFNKVKYLFSHKPKVIVTPFLYNDCDLQGIVYNSCGKTKKIFNLQWEQIYNKTSDDTAKQTPCGNARFAVHSCWGEKPLDRLAKAGIEHALLLGNPSLDFLKTNFEKWYYTRANIDSLYRFPEGKKMILFLSSFSYVSCDYKALKALNTLVDFDPFVFKDISVKTRKILFNWFDKYLKENNDVYIVYRPHPAEKYDDEIDQLVKKHKNFYCISDYSVRQWIKVSDIVLNWYSTSAVDAYFAGKSTMFLRPINIPDSYDYTMFENIVKITKYDDFKNGLNGNVFFTNNDVLHKNISENYLADSSYSYVNICNVLEEIIKTNNYDMPKEAIKINWRKVVHKQIKGLINCAFVNVYRKWPNVCNRVYSKRLKRHIETDNLRIKEEITEKDILDFKNRMVKISVK